MWFEEADFQDEFDGVWARSSLLHVPEAELIEVFRRLMSAVKSGSVLYASFRYGNQRTNEGTATIHCHERGPLAGRAFIRCDASPARIYRTADARPNANQFDFTVYGFAFRDCLPDITGSSPSALAH